MHRFGAKVSAELYTLAFNLRGVREVSFGFLSPALSVSQSAVKSVKSITKQADKFFAHMSVLLFFLLS